MVEKKSIDPFLEKLKNILNKSLSTVLFTFIFFMAGISFLFSSFALMFWFIEYGADPTVILWMFRIWDFFIWVMIFILAFKLWVWICEKYLMPYGDKIAAKRKKKLHEDYSHLAKLIAKEIKNNKKKK